MEESNLGVVYIGFLAARAPEKKGDRFHTIEISGHVQWNLYKATTKFCGLSRRVVSYHRENKHDFVKTVPGKLWNLCVFSKTFPVSLYRFHCILALSGCMVTLKAITNLNSFGPSDAIWRRRSGSTLAQVMACCLMAPSHYLKQCWLTISKVQWHASGDNSF